MKNQKLVFVLAALTLASASAFAAQESCETQSTKTVKAGSLCDPKTASCSVEQGATDTHSDGATDHKATSTKQ